MLSVLSRLFDENKKQLERYQRKVVDVNALEPKIKKLSDEELVVKTSEFRRRAADGESLDSLIVEAFAVIREAIRRAFSERAYDVQLMAALALHEGKIAEQRTGEGKTLSAAIASYLNALSGHGVHVVTVNDYLARRDAGWYGQALTNLGLTVGCIIHEQSFLVDLTHVDPNQVDERLSHFRPVSRKEAYLADITYGTNNEFGFDYLRDNMQFETAQMAQRGHAFAVVDEVDSILIDEARTPLIISSPDEEATDKYYEFAKTVDRLNPSTDYVIDEKFRTANLTEHGIAKLEKWLGISNLYEKDFEVVHHVEQALKARSLFQRDRDYIVKDGEVIIVDEFTGRLMIGRRYSEGLHQAIEAKENVKIQQESKTLATVSFQNYFRMYDKLSGMTGTAATEAEEFHKIYKLEVIVVPTNKPMVRKDEIDIVYKTAKAKFSAVADAVLEDHKKGRPVLIGTTSIEKNDLISTILSKRGIKHQVLNAKNHEREAQIIAQAGQKSAVTVATNIAGRGVDIKLGEGVAKLGGLHIIGTEHHESRRIDNQLRGRAGRQGDPGSSRFFVSLEDDIMRLFGGDQIAKAMTSLKLPDNQPLEHSFVGRIIKQAQIKVETFHFDARKHVVEFDDVMNKQREIIYSFRKKIIAETEEILKAHKEGQDIGDKAFALKNEILSRIDAEFTSIVERSSSSEAGSFEVDRIIEAVKAIVPFDPDTERRLRNEILARNNREGIIELLKVLGREAYEVREQNFGFERMRQLENFVIIAAVNMLWIEHLDAMADLREGISLRGYAQKDPLVEYKAEGFTMFEQLMDAIDSEIVRRFYHWGFAEAQAAPPQRQIFSHGDTIETVSTTSSQKQSHTVTVHEGGKPSAQSPKKIGRNDPCWCGSGKKYKKCHYPN